MSPVVVGAQWKNTGSVSAPWLAMLAMALLVQTSGAVEFTRQVLPAKWSHQSVVWHDVNGDGRKDFVAQAQRRLEVYFLNERHRLGRSPGWRVEIAPPWDLWAFADVLPDLPGEELLALSPKGVGWLSYQNRTTSTAQMQMLIKTDLPLTWDKHHARHGRFVIPWSKGGPPTLILPSRSAFRIFQPTADAKNWEVREEIAAPNRPWPSFGADSSPPYLVGWDRWRVARMDEPLTPTQPGRLEWREFRFYSSWSARDGRLIDWNGDGRLDWATSSEGKHKGLRIYPQTEQGTFDRDHPITPSLPARDNEQDEGEGRDRRDRSSDESDQRWFLELGVGFIENLADVNGDGRLDLVRISTLDNWAAPKSRVAVHLQTAEGAFRKEPDSVRRLGAIVPTDDLPLADVDSDGDLDLLLLRLDLRVASVHSHMKAFLRRGLETYLGAHLWSGRSGFAKRPAWEKRVMIGHDLFEFSRDPQPLMVFDRDLTGDGRPDLVLRLTRHTVGVFAMTDPGKGFPEEATAMFELPFNVEGLWCDDLDGDGLTDVLVTGWDEDEPNRLPRVVFFAEPAKSKGKAP